MWNKKENGYTHENGASWVCPLGIYGQNTLIYCIQKRLNVTCVIKISNTIMWYLNQDPFFILDNNSMENLRQGQKVILSKKSFKLSQILNDKLIPNLSSIVQKYIY
jgi:hypothetical protein